MNRVSVPTVSQRAAVENEPAPGGLRARVRIWLSIAVAAAAFLALVGALSSGLGLVDMARWAGAQQRAFYGMVSKLLALEGGGLRASLALVGLCLAYGFLHAAIPGHGKFLIAGAGLASRVSTVRLVGLSLLASLAQALTAIVLVYGSFALLDITAGWAMAATDKVLIPASYLAIAGIAVILIRRALKNFRSLTQTLSLKGFVTGSPAHPDAQGHDHEHVHDHEHAHGHAYAHDHVHDENCGCGHRHGPTLEEVDALRSWRDVVMLVAGIGLRPCTGAVFVLVASWRIGLLWVGAGAAVAMALGTGAFISLVALSATSARGATLFAAGASRARIILPLLQLVAGVAILLIAIAFLVATVWPG